jgi:hypothetical protein
MGPHRRIGTSHLSRIRGCPCTSVANHHLNSKLPRICRGIAAPVDIPKEGLFRVPSGAFRLVWFSRLSASHRNLRLKRSVMVNTLVSDESTRAKPGPSKAFRPRLPSVPNAGTPNADAFTIPVRNCCSVKSFVWTGVSGALGRAYVVPSAFQSPLLVMVGTTPGAGRPRWWKYPREGPFRKRLSWRESSHQTHGSTRRGIGSERGCCRSRSRRRVAGH